MQKNLVATLYIKDGMAVNGLDDYSNPRPIVELAKIYNDSGIDKIICWDLSEDDEEHDKNILTIRDINRNSEIKTAAGGNIKRLDDIKRLFYAGCCEVILNGSKKDTIDLLNEAVEEFGPDKILVSVKNVDFLFKNQDTLADKVHELLIMENSLFEGLENITQIPYIINFEKYDKNKIVSLLQSEQVRGISGEFLNDVSYDIMSIKAELSEAGIKMDNFEAKLNWSDLKLNSDGMVPVVVQDHQSNEVLMVAYMNEEAFNTTIKLGKMTYWSRSRNELWLKGATSGHYQYVKSLTADCDNDTILAKVSQVGAACHTGARSCFFNEIVKKEYVEKQPIKVFEANYKKIVDRKNNPKKGSYTSDLFEAGIDAILKKCGEESTEITIAAKNRDKDELTHEMADYLYNLMVLMVECDLTWDELREELSSR